MRSRGYAPEACNGREEKDKIRIKSWGHGLLKYWRGGLDDDDGGVEETGTSSAVRNVETEVVAPLELVVSTVPNRAESAYVVKAEQVVRFEVRPANADAESGSETPGGREETR